MSLSTSGVSGDDQDAVAVQKPAEISRPDAAVAHRLDLASWHDGLDRAYLTARPPGGGSRPPVPPCSPPCRGTGCPGYTRGRGRSRARAAGPPARKARLVLDPPGFPGHRAARLPFRLGALRRPR